MNNEITPPLELMRKWDEEAAIAPMVYQHYIAIKAASWGANQELEACCEQLRSLGPGQQTIDRLRSARRPQPPSLKEQALSELNLTADPNGAELSRTQVELIRRALEALDD